MFIICRIKILYPIEYFALSCAVWCKSVKAGVDDDDGDEGDGVSLIFLLQEDAANPFCCFWFFWASPLDILHFSSIGVKSCSCVISDSSLCSSAPLFLYHLSAKGMTADSGTAWWNFLSVRMNMIQFSEYGSVVKSWLFCSLATRKYLSGHVKVPVVGMSWL